MSKILIVEDDVNISKMETTLLTRAGYEVISAFSGTEALLVLEKNPVDLILLDLMLPGLDGEEVLETIRKKQEVSILCVTAVDDMETKVRLIRKGADDYITKPFHNEELLVRIEALLRRSNHIGEVQSLDFKDIHMDQTNHQVFIGGESLELTKKEYDILELMMHNPKKVFTKDNIYESVWQEEYLPEDNAVNVYVSNLRNKLAKRNPDGAYIKTVWGIGFKLSEE